MHGLRNMFYLERKTNIHAIFSLHLFVEICLPLADFLTFFWKGVSCCHEMLHLKCGMGPNSSSICTNMNCMCKQYYATARQKITGHFQFKAEKMISHFQRILNGQKVKFAVMSVDLLLFQSAFLTSVNLYMFASIKSYIETDNIFQIMIFEWKSCV